MGYQKYTDYDSKNPNLPVLYNDASIGTGTRVLLDVFDPNCYSKHELPVGLILAGTPLINLVNNQPELIVGTVDMPALGTAGLKFEVGTTQNVKLPARAKLDMAVVTHFGISAWLKPGAIGIASGWDSPMSHMSAASAAGTAWYVQRNASNPTRYVCAVAASSSVINISQDEEAWVFIDAYIDNVAKTSRIDVYKNGALAASGPVTALPAGWNPAIQADPILGKNPLYAAAWAGQIGRVSIEDFTVPRAKTVAQFIADELIQGAGRFV